ncbi:hypothetical protein [Lactobacillus phage Lbab1]|nr:hypothetical protein [Lactobacillus phage Lbab1]
MAIKYISEAINDSGLDIDGNVLVITTKNFPYPHFSRGKYAFSVKKVGGDNYAIYPMVVQGGAYVPADSPVVQTQGDNIFFTTRSDLAPNIDDIDQLEKVQSYEKKQAQVLQAFVAYAEREFAMANYNIVMTDWETIEKAASVPVTGIAVTPTTLSLTVKGTKTVAAVFTPSNATDQSVKFASKDPLTATVDTKGVVTGVKTGETDVTVTDSTGKFTATCHVTVA